MKREPLKLRSNSVNAMIAHTVIKQSFFIAIEAERRTGLFHPPYIRVCIRVCVCTIRMYVYIYMYPFQHIDCLSARGAYLSAPAAFVI